MKRLLLSAIPLTVFGYGLWCFLSGEGYSLAPRHGGPVEGRAAEKIGLAYMVAGVYVYFRVCVQSETFRSLGYIFDWVCFLALAVIVFLL